MPYKNFNDRHFTEQEIAALNEALAALESILTPKLASLTSEERIKFGSIDEVNKKIVNKAKDYHENQKELDSPDVDWDEFMNDYLSRETLEATIKRLKNLDAGLSSAKMLHDHDNLQAARADKKHADYKVSVGDAKYKAKSDDYAKLTKRGGSKNDIGENDEPATE